VVEIRKIGMQDDPAAPLVPTTKSANPDGTESSTDGITLKPHEIPPKSEFETRMAASLPKRTNIRAAPSSKVAGSATKRTIFPRQKAPMPTMINHHVTENGASVTDMAQTATGIAVPNLTMSLNGWIVTTETNLDEHIRRRISSAGRSA
jgi:hypothetical protein